MRFLESHHGLDGVVVAIDFMGMESRLSTLDAPQNAI